MTLWLDAGTVKDNYVIVEDGQDDAVTFNELVVSGRPRVEVTVPAGVGFRVAVEEFMREFSGSDPDVDVQNAGGQIDIANGRTMVVRPDEACTVVFSTTNEAMGPNFGGW